MDDLVEGLRCDVDERGVATVTIDRPEAGNSLTSAMRDGLAERFEELSATLGVGRIVLTGAGERHFCTGAGLGGLLQEAPPPSRRSPRAGPSATCSG